MKLKSAVVFVGALLILPVASHAQSVGAAPLTTAAGPQAHLQTPNFQTIDRCKGNLVRADLGAGWVGYTRIRFEPVAYEPSNPDRRLNPRDVSKISSIFAASLDSAFRKDSKYEPGNGTTVLVKPIITNVKRTNTLINLISFAAVQMPASYGAASVRYELVDEATGKQIGEITSSRSARPWNVYPWNLLQNFQALGQSSVILKSDAKSLRRDLERLSKLPAAQSGAPSTGALPTGAE
jgi:hypothetical protein